MVYFFTAYRNKKFISVTCYKLVTLVQVALLLTYSRAAAPRQAGSGSLRSPHHKLLPNAA